MLNTGGQFALRPLTFLLAATVLLAGGCGVGDDVMATIGVPPAGTPGADGQSRPQQPEVPSEPDSGRYSMQLTGKQRDYLNALSAAGVRPSSDLQAMSIGLSVCQARAAKQNDQAVWDFVLPMVRTDIRTVRRSVTAPSPSEVDASTAAYVQTATERLC